MRRMRLPTVVKSVIRHTPLYIYHTIGRTRVTHDTGPDLDFVQTTGKSSVLSFYPKPAFKAALYLCFLMQDKKLKKTFKKRMMHNLARHTYEVRCKTFGRL